MTQTERFEQEVTINLEQEGGAPSPAADDKPNQSLIQLDELIKTTINQEVTSFYIDYGGHISQQFVALLCLLAVHKLPVRDRFVYPGTAYYLAKVLCICFWIRKMKGRNLQRVIYLVELLASLTIVAGLHLFESRLFVVPLLLFVLLFISQIILYCLNFADSIDQTFLFKLVRPPHPVHEPPQDPRQAPDLPHLHQAILRDEHRVDDRADAHLAGRLRVLGRLALLQLHLARQAGGLHLQEEEQARE